MPNAAQNMLFKTMKPGDIVIDAPAKILVDDDTIYFVRKAPVIVRDGWCIFTPANGYRIGELHRVAATRVTITTDKD
jgi:hypothetical protein